MLGLSTPTALQLDRILNELIPAREDAQPHVGWPGASVRRYRNNLYLLPEISEALSMPQEIAGDSVPLGKGLGVLHFENCAGQGLAAELVERGLRLEMRKGGEEFKPVGQSHTRKLKKLLQEEGVVPWMRDRLPLVYSGGELVAVGDLWLAEGAAATPGIAIRWSDRPPLH